MDIVRLYQDYGIDFVTEGHRHSQPGWVNCACPFCTGHDGFHLGYNLDGDYYFCWRCGGHPVNKTVSALINLPEMQVKELLKSYGAKYRVPRINSTPQKQKPFKLPTNCQVLSAQHRKYLTQRDFDAEKIERLWNLQGTKHVSLLDDIDYRFRIIIPFFWDGEMVSFDARDITGKQISKYKACPKWREIMHRKDILYGKQEHWTETGVCVEGPTDVWRLGVNSFAVCGIEYTHKQVRLIANTFKRVAVMFDDEPQAQVQAKKLVAELKFRGVDAWNVEITGDPGSLKQTDADELIKKLMK